MGVQSFISVNTCTHGTGYAQTATQVSYTPRQSHHAQLLAFLSIHACLVHSKQGWGIVQGAPTHQDPGATPSLCIPSLDVFTLCLCVPLVAECSGVAIRSKGNISPIP